MGQGFLATELALGEKFGSPQPWRTFPIGFQTVAGAQPVFRGFEVKIIAKQHQMPARPGFTCQGANMTG